MKGKIIQKQQLAEDLFGVKIEVPAPIVFKPGQFMSIEVGEGLRRSYSLSNLPASNILETYVDTTPMGPGSIFFLDAKVGQELSFLVPLGQFVYKEKELETKPAYFFATGTGVVPFLSMIRYALEVQETKREILLHLGASTEDKLIGHSMWLDLEKRFPNFKYVPHVTRSSSWVGEKDRITGKAHEVPKNSDVYICGDKNMISDVEALLLQKGIKKENIYYERFY